MKEEKTNVMRILDQKKIAYESFRYGDGTAMSGSDLADFLGMDHAKVFKTLVTVGKSGEHYVFDVPVDRELDLKKAAAAVGEKNIEMIPQKELLPLTGYIHGGCSPIGMKKFFRTTFDLSAQDLDTVTFSAGKIGYQVRLTPADLARTIRVQFCDICKE